MEISPDLLEILTSVRIHCRGLPHSYHAWLLLIGMVTCPELLEPKMATDFHDLAVNSHDIDVIFS